MKSYMLALAFTLTACITGGQCPIPDVTPLPKWNGQVYIGDATKKAVVRAQSNTAISCEDPKFSEMVCMAHPDFLDLASQIQACRERFNAVGGIPE